jgi:uncharacterized protein (DUF2147 family)
MTNSTLALASRALAAMTFFAFAASAQAQMTPVGLWKTIDDNDGSPKAEIRISDKDGVLSGKIEKVYRSTFIPTTTCDMCKDERKGQLVLGLEIMRDLKKTEGQDVWEGGTILDSESGTIYKAKVTPIEGGTKLEMRGFVGFALLGRTQTWVRLK